MTAFQKAILTAVQMVPSGHVASYGQIAAYIGTPRAARQVGWAMHSMEGTPDFPWWRILNNAGKITIKGNQFNTAQLQKELLEAEGVRVSSDFELSMAVYRFRPSGQMLEACKLDPEYINQVLARYTIG